MGSRSGRPVTRISARLLSVLLAAWLAGCATTPPEKLSDRNRDICVQRFTDNDRLIERAGRHDPGISRISGFPYLRSNRFLASFRDELTGRAQLEAWTRHLAELDRVARQLETADLRDPVLRREAQSQLHELDRCRESLRHSLLDDPTALTRLRMASRVADDYLMSWRILGLYPLTAPFVALRITDWHDDTLARFDLPLQELPVTGTLTRWSTRRDAAPGGVGPEWKLDALGIPQPDANMIERLLNRHAPIWEVDVTGDDDRIGTVTWRAGAQVNTGLATEYRLLSYTRLGTRILPQLNYLIWFPSRPSDDIYGGRFDGLHWRVTLGPDGRPWLYDSIHHCGCYYLAFPSEHLRPRKSHQIYTEPALVPQIAPPGPLVLRIAPVTHYIERIYTLDNALKSRHMAPQPYDRLRALPAENGHHSLFGEHGLVAGSERPERFLLWPMGIRSPGAMRQVGRHAIAFVGRRHFDDPFLLTALFEVVEAE